MRAGLTEMLQHDIKWLEKLIHFTSKPKLFVFVGSVLSPTNPKGIGVGQFIKENAPNLWGKPGLQRRRWPQTRCSKSNLAQRVYNARDELLRVVNA